MGIFLRKDGKYENSKQILEFALAIRVEIWGAHDLLTDMRDLALT